jgi:hypothetical protein
MFKIPESASIRFPGVPCFAVVIIRDPVFFDIMTGAAFAGFSEIRAFVITSNRPHVVGRVKSFMDVTTLAILIDHFIVFCRSELSLESIFNAPFSASCHKKNKRRQKYPKKNDPVPFYFHWTCKRISILQRGK